jgi:hypothetical protein
MKFMRLSIAAGLMAVLGGVLWWSNKQEAAKEGKPSPDAPPKILELKEENIGQLEIKTRDAGSTVLKKNSSGKWDITAPAPMAADSGTVSSIFSTVSSLSADRVVDENPADLASYGLDPPVATVTFTGTDGKTTTLRIGEATATGSDVYVMKEGDKRLFTAYSSVKDSLAKNSKDLRDKHLMLFDQEKMSRVELAAAGKTPIEFGRIGQNEWQILKPKPMRADGWQIEDLLGRLKQVALDPEVDSQKAAAGFASAQPVATVKVTGPDGVKTIEIRKAKDDVYAKSSLVSGTFKVNKDAADNLGKSVDEFRNKKLFDFAFNDPSKIEIKDGATNLALEKTADKWSSGGKTMDSVSVQNVIDKLRDLSAAKFVDSGFTTPAIELTVVSDQGKRTEKVQIAAAGNDFLARRENDSSLYQLTGDAIKDLRQAAGGVKESTPAPSAGNKK